MGKVVTTTGHENVDMVNGELSTAQLVKDHTHEATGTGADGGGTLPGYFTFERNSGFYEHFRKQQIGSGPVDWDLIISGGCDTLWSDDVLQLRLDTALSSITAYSFYRIVPNTIGIPFTVAMKFKVDSNTSGEAFNIGVVAIESANGSIVIESGSTNGTIRLLCYNGSSAYTSDIALDVTAYQELYLTVYAGYVTLWKDGVALGTVSSYVPTNRQMNLMFSYQNNENPAGYQKKIYVDYINLIPGVAITG